MKKKKERGTQSFSTEVREREKRRERLESRKKKRGVVFHTESARRKGSSATRGTNGFGKEGSTGTSTVLHLKLAK